MTHIVSRTPHAPRMAPVATLGLALLLVGGLPAVDAVAQSRPDSLSMSCGQAASLVERKGTVVIGSGPYIYDRFVRNCRFCYDFEFLIPAWIPTADNRQCFVGYRCNNQTDTPMPSCGFTGYRGQ
jgi:hypothetical protein